MEKEKSGLRQRIEAKQAEQRLERDILLTRQRTGLDIRSEADMRAAVGQPVSVAPVISELTAEQREHQAEANREKPIGEPTLASVFADYQQWRANGGLKSNTKPAVLTPEANRFNTYLRDTPLCNTPISQLDDKRAIELLDKMKNGGVKYSPRLECKKTLSQMASFLRDEGHRSGALLFQKLRVKKTDEEERAESEEEDIKYYDPSAEIPIIFQTIAKNTKSAKKRVRRCAIEQWDAASCLYLGVFRNVDIKGDSAPEIGGLRWEEISGVWGDDWLQKPFKIRYWNTKAGNNGKWCTKYPHPDLREILRARWERQGCPSSGLVFINPATGTNFARGHDWGLEELIHNEAGIEKQEGRAIHAFRHSGAVAAASGVWGKDGKPGGKWTQKEIADTLLNDTFEAAARYVRIAKTAQEELSSGTVSQLGAWGLTVESKNPDPATDVDVDTDSVGAGDEIRTHDFNLGKVALYH